MEHTKDKGDLAEAAVIKRLKESHQTVSIPFGDNAPYDLIRDDGELHRVQVKYGTRKNGCVVAELRRTQRSNGETVHNGYDSTEIDEFAIYCPETGEVYSVTIDDAPATGIMLRIEDPEIDDPNIRWASDYLIDSE